MTCVPVGARQGLRWGCFGLATTIAILAISSDPAEARRHRRSSGKQSAQSSYSPPYAAIVVDGRTGSVLHQANPDAPRHPASLTKIMTLYLLFERLESGKIALDTTMPVSSHASSQSPTKLGLKPGDRLLVEDAIKGLVTKSANDASVVLAEALAGTEEEFASQMTRKARSLGMNRTTYRNANGLPNDEQITTARDQALLGIAIRERFPKYYRYFSTPSFTFRGKAMRNHNRLLGNVEGVDGIKTGFTVNSGFNLVSSVKRGPRHIVAVVLGGRSAVSRDNRMRELITAHIDDASSKPVLVASANPDVAPVRVASAAEILIKPPESTATISAGSSAPLTPVKVKTVTVKLVKTASAAPTPSMLPVEAATSVSPASPEQTLVASLAAMAPVEAAPAPVPAAAPVAVIRPQVVAPKPAVVASVAPTASNKAADLAFAQAPSKRAITAGWVIQVGAYEDAGEAKQHLSSARSKITRALEKAEAYIERTVKGSKTYYRARFAGFDRDEAEETCKKLKKEDIACMAVRI